MVPFRPLCNIGHNKGTHWPQEGIWFGFVVKCVHRLTVQSHLQPSHCNLSPDSTPGRGTYTTNPALEITSMVLQCNYVHAGLWTIFVCHVLYFVHVIIIVTAYKNYSWKEAFPSRLTSDEKTENAPASRYRGGIRVSFHHNIDRERYITTLWYSTSALSGTYKTRASLLTQARHIRCGLRLKYRIS